MSAYLTSCRLPLEWLEFLYLLKIIHLLLEYLFSLPNEYIYKYEYKQISASLLMHASTLLFLGVFNLQSSPKLAIRITNQKKNRARERRRIGFFHKYTHTHTQETFQTKMIYGKCPLEIRCDCIRQMLSNVIAMGGECTVHIHCKRIVLLLMLSCLRLNCCASYMFVCGLNGRKIAIH